MHLLGETGQCPVDLGRCRLFAETGLSFVALARDLRELSETNDVRCQYVMYSITRQESCTMDGVAKA